MQVDVSVCGSHLATINQYSVIIPVHLDRLIMTFFMEGEHKMMNCTYQVHHCKVQGNNF